MIKKLHLLLLLIGFSSFGQVASDILNSRNTDTGANPGRFLYVVAGNNALRVTDRSHLILPVSQITGMTGTGQRVSLFNSDGTWADLPLSNFSYTSTDGIAKSGNNFTLDWSYVTAHGNWAIKADTSSVYTKAKSAALFKSIGWFPSWSEVTGKPSLFDGDYNSLTNRPTLFSGAYADLSGNPTLFSGSYLDLTNKPSLFSGAYADLTGKPSLFSGAYSDLSGKPTLFDGQYASLSGAPSIPAAQINSDWNAVSGLATILNKPTIPTNNNQLANGSGYLTSVPAQSFASLTSKPTTLSGYGITDAYPLSGNPSGFLSSVPAQSFASLTGKPTTLSGYGITDAYPLSGNPSGFLTSVPAQSFASLTGKPTTLAGYGITDSYVTPTINSAVTRPINSTTFTVSTTKQAYVSYNVNISCTATIGSAASGSVALQYSTNAGSSWVTVGTVSNSNTVTLAVVLNSVQASGLQLSGYIPANGLVRMVSTSSGVNGVITYLTGQETY